jgi:hypothetical protein
VKRFVVLTTIVLVLSTTIGCSLFSTKSNLATNSLASDATDVFEVGKVYNLSVSDAGDKVVIECTVKAIKGSWVSCDSRYKDSAGQTANRHLWVNTNSVSVVRPN